METLREVLRGMREQPACLAAIALSALFAGLTYMAMQSSEQRSHEARMAILERCFAFGLEKN